MGRTLNGADIIMGGHNYGLKGPPSAHVISAQIMSDKVCALCV